MSRVQIIALSVIDCVFGVLSLSGPDSLQTVSRVINVVLGVALIFIAGRDLKQRGWQYGYLIGLTYILPLVGLLTYLSMSDRPKRDTHAIA